MIEVSVETDVAKALREEAEIWERMYDNGTADWERHMINFITQTFPQLSVGEAMAVYRLGYLRGYERAQNTLERAKQLFC